MDTNVCRDQIEKNDFPNCFYNGSKISKTIKWWNIDNIYKGFGLRHGTLFYVEKMLVR